MSNDDAADIPLLAALREKDRAKVLANARRRTFAPGDVVVREGDTSLNLFLVVSGHALVRHDDGVPVAALGPGEFFGELGLVEQHARTATVVAQDELTCILLPAWEFRTLLEEHPEMAVPMVHALIRRLHGLTPHEH
ncbi:MAG TPA: cyclic nucleotide-binding domain-containing protein [Candidatus Limnocylindrales bacterium]|jgi:CRP/FNR family cyclic AMP-dependent transcriptional regulator